MSSTGGGPCEHEAEGDEEVAEEGRTDRLLSRRLMMPLSMLAMPATWAVGQCASWLGVTKQATRKCYIQPDAFEYKLFLKVLSCAGRRLKV